MCEPFSFLVEEIVIYQDSDMGTRHFTDEQIKKLFATPMQENKELYESPLISPVAERVQQEVYQEMIVKEVVEVIKFNQRLFDQIRPLVLEFIDDASYKAEYDKRNNNIDQLYNQANRPFSNYKHQFTTMTDKQHFKISDRLDVQTVSQLCQKSTEKAKVLNALQNPMFRKTQQNFDTGKVHIYTVESQSAHKTKVVTKPADTYIESLGDDFYVSTNFNRSQHLNDQITQQIKKNQQILTKRK